MKQKSGRKKDFSQKLLTRLEALKLLGRSGCSEGIRKHCLAVSKQAVKLAKSLQERGYDVDLQFVETAGLLHDIGRSVTHGIRHGIGGANMLKDYPRYARVCERHIGAGIGKDEAKKLGLPARDYIPRTLEEEIIAHADNMTEGSKVVSIDETIQAYEKKFGRDHPATLRIMQLNEKMKKMLGE